MKQSSDEVAVSTDGAGLYDITPKVLRFVAESRVSSGLLTVFLRHTSASLIIQENADPTVQDDLNRFFSRLVPDGDPLFCHTAEGPDDMPAHVKAALTAVSLSIPVIDRTPALGTWQGIYLFEHRQASHRRRVTLSIIGD